MDYQLPKKQSILREYPESGDFGRSSSSTFASQDESSPSENGSCELFGCRKEGNDSPSRVDVMCSSISLQLDFHLS